MKTFEDCAMMMQGAVKNIGLRFLLEHGHSVDAIMPQDKAVEIVGNWTRGGMEAGKFSGFDEVGRRWFAVDMRRVQGLVTFPLEEPGQQRQIGPGSRLMPGTSGVN